MTFGFTAEDHLAEVLELLERASRIGAFAPDDIAPLKDACDFLAERGWDFNGAQWYLSQLEDGETNDTTQLHGPRRRQACRSAGRRGVSYAGTDPD